MNLRELRFQKKYSQWDVSVLSHIPQPKISLIEKGYIEPKPNELKKLADIFKVDPNDIELTRPRVLGGV